MTRHFAYLLLPVLLIGALITACAVDPERSPGFQNLAKKVKDFEEKTKRDIDSLSIGLQDVGLEVKNLPAKAKPDAKTAADLAAAVERINTLEQEVKKLTEALNKREMAVASSVKAASGASAADKTGSPGATRSSARPAPAKGSYYQVKEGDTLQSIAKTHNVTAAEICRANRLPMTAVPRPGSPLFIPSK
jgi:LysM repeat protein